MECGNFIGIIHKLGISLPFYSQKKKETGKWYTIIFTGIIFIEKELETWRCHTGIPAPNLAGKFQQRPLVTTLLKAEALQNRWCSAGA